MPATPRIDPRSLTPAQHAGHRCATPNCRRRLGSTAVTIGHTPDRQPVKVCRDCAPACELVAAA